MGVSIGIGPSNQSKANKTNSDHQREGASQTFGKLFSAQFASGWPKRSGNSSQIWSTNNLSQGTMKASFGVIYGIDWVRGGGYLGLE